jgi:hypothetical protein
MSDTPNPTPAESKPEKIKLVPITIESSYKKNGQKILLPAQLAWCTPRMRDAIYKLRAIVIAAGGRLELSDLYRTPKQQAAAHARYLAAKKEWEAIGSPPGRKPKYSPPAGGSLHQGGEAMDVSLDALGGLAGFQADQILDRFWPLAQECGFRPIIREPDERRSEAWHFDFWDAEREELYKKGGYKAAAAAQIARVEIPEPLR